MTEVTEREYFAVSSDHHIGGVRTDTLRVLRSLRTATIDNPDVKKCKALLFTGDLFDRAMELSDPKVPDIIEFAYDLGHFCAVNKIVIFLLRGTPSHEVGQPAIFKTIFEKAFKNSLTYHYSDQLEILRDTVIGDVLMVPDEWRANPDDTWTEVCELLKENNLEQVDYALMHGFFGFQVPKEYGVPYHVEERYLGIVKRHIFIGHDHDFKSFQRITVPGSLERHRFGEEGPKGWLMVKQNPKRDLVTFVENVGAKVYKTLDCTGLPLEDVQALIDKTAAKLASGSYIRLEGNVVDPVALSYKELIGHHADIKFESKFKREKIKPETVVGASEEAAGNFLEINRENIAEITLERIDESKRQYCAELLKEFVENVR